LFDHHNIYYVLLLVFETKGEFRGERWWFSRKKVYELW
jgi:hypothetical protein